ncbi:MAG: Fic family protein [Hyphomicrobiales bacterium]|nr:Fic family protein [Hyphomicrobiales bacterium]
MRIIPLTALIELHAESLAKHGGASGTRDLGAIEAALARADQLLAYADPLPDAVDVAAAVSAALCRAHGFVDGNKRASAIALGVTSHMNGLYLDITQGDGERMFLALAAGELSEDAFRDWVRAHCVDD